MNRKKIKLSLFLLSISILFFLSCKYIVGANKSKNTICIDIGHGGYDPGAVVGENLEKDITLKAGLTIGMYLEETGYNVVYTRKDDESLDTNKTKDMHKRLKVINSNHLLYISIHANIYTNKIPHGTQCFYKKNDLESEKLASSIQKMVKIFDKTNTRFEKSITGKFLIENANTTGCIVELGFMTNKDDLTKMTDEKELNRLCLYIYKGILDYLENR